MVSRPLLVHVVGGLLQHPRGRNVVGGLLQHPRERNVVGGLLQHPRGRNVVGGLLQHPQGREMPFFLSLENRWGAFAPSKAALSTVPIVRRGCTLFARHLSLKCDSVKSTEYLMRSIPCVIRPISVS